MQPDGCTARGGVTIKAAIRVNVNEVFTFSHARITAGQVPEGGSLIASQSNPPARTETIRIVPMHGVDGAWRIFDDEHQGFLARISASALVINGVTRTDVGACCASAVPAANSSSTVRVLKIVMACSRSWTSSGPCVMGEFGATTYPPAVAPMHDQDKPDLSKPNALSNAPGTVWKPTLTRFQALIDITRKVRSDNSFSDSCVRTCS